ncbi:MAG: NFACT family protein [Firmicutes bacterium]|nr:NFACT family protein [Bacillota bacterium]
MAYDGLVTGAVVRRLQEALIGGRIEKVYQPEKDEIVLLVHRGKEKHKLLLSSNGNCPRMHLTEESWENPAAPPAFCMLLRKYFQGSRIEDVRQAGSDRVVEIPVSTADEMGYSVSRRLVMEIMGKHSNLIAVEEESGKIIDSIKRITPEMSRLRQILPGLVYEYPPAQGKISFYGLTAETLEAALRQTGKALPESLVAALQGISPGAAEEICIRAAMKQGATDYENLAPEAILAVLEGFLKAIQDQNLSPAVYLDTQGTPKDFHALPLSHLENALTVLPFPEAGAAAEAFFKMKGGADRTKQKSNDLLKVIRGNLDKQTLKKQRLLEDLRQAEDSDIYRLCGELLTAALHMVPAGAEKVTVPNYYDGSTMEIALDPRFTPPQNAQRYYKKYAKARTAIREKKLQLEETEEAITYLESVLTFAEQAPTPEAVEEVRQELTEGGYLRRRKVTGKVKPAKPRPMEFQTSEGFRVLVGRNNKENDHLTFKMAEKTDIWFHTKDIPGSHVILFTEKREPGEASLFEAASMAAWFSKGRSSENVPVDYVRVRHVKKPAGAKPGMVIFTDNRTLYVTPKEPK